MTKDNAPSGERRVLGFHFEPVPRIARSARRLGLLSGDQYDLLGFLYGSADFGALAHRRETPRLTLERIAEGIRWVHTNDALSKLLRRTSDGGWFDYRVERAKGGTYLYLFRLNPEGPQAVRAVSELEAGSVSELEEAETPHREPDSATREAEAVRAGNAPETGSLSEQGGDLSELDLARRPLAERDSGAARPEPVRAAQNNREELLLEGALTNNVSLGVEVPEEGEPVEDLVESTYRLLAVAREIGSNPNPVASATEQAQRASERNGGRPPVRVEVADDGSLGWSPPKPVVGEKGILADAQALVDAGLAQWVDEEVSPA
jgi:hypothetical protein